MEKGKKIDSVVVDTGIIFALADRGDAWHVRCTRFIRDYRGILIVPCTVIPEACYLLNTYLGAQAELRFIQSLINREITVDHFQSEDLARCSELLTRYGDLNLGLVDASVVAVCERRNVFTILTTDRKHFSVVRSKQGRSFDLHP